MKDDATNKARKMRFTCADGLSVHIKACTAINRWQFTGSDDEAVSARIMKPLLCNLQVGKQKHRATNN